MKPFYKIILALTIPFCLLFTGCAKENDLLNEKPDQSLNTITTLKSLQLMSQNENVFNSMYPAYGIVSSDDFYLEYSTWLSAFPSERNAYIWSKEIFLENENGDDWTYPYQMAFYANTILSSLESIPPGNDQVLHNQVRGSALFYRSIAFFNLLQDFAPPYDAALANSLPGIPLPVIPDINAKLDRSPLNICYERITSDLKSAVLLLPVVTTSKTLPSKAAALALLSRIYLVMGDYPNALNYAAQSLSLFSTLQDFNKLPANVFLVFNEFSPEESFHAGVAGFSSTSTRARIDTTLRKMYNDPNDLRPSIFFYDNRGVLQFNSKFDRNINITYALSTAEMLFNKAEAEARTGDAVNAIKDLNTVLINRWKSGTFVPYSGQTADQALYLILKERRKEFAMTTLRWSDLRRLNKDPRFAVTLTRNLNGVVYQLPPNDPRYTLPIPNRELRFNPIEQNIR